MYSPFGEASGTGLPQFEQNVDWYGGGLYRTGAAYDRTSSRPLSKR